MHVSYRLCYVKLKLLLIAIEYKSEQRESRFVYWTFPFSTVGYNRGTCFKMPHISPQTPLAAFIVVDIHVTFDDNKWVEDI